MERQVEETPVWRKVPGVAWLESIDRLHYLAVLIFSLTLFIIARLFNLQVTKGSLYASQASDQHEIWQKLNPRRGEVFVIENGQKIPIISNKNYLSLYAVPGKIEKPGWSAKLVSEAVGIDQLELERKFLRIDDPFVMIKRKLSDEEIVKVRELKITGLAFSEDGGRYYPDKNLFSHVVGFVGYVGETKKGRYGIEGHWDEVLSGKEGYSKAEKDLSGRLLALSDRQTQAAENGSSLILTLDRTIQFYTCRKLAETVTRLEATGGSVIIMNPETGAIITLCGYPDYDPNIYNQVSGVGIYNNPAIFGDYEPGSTFKVVTMAAGLDTDKIKPETTYDDEGFVKFDKYTIKNSDGKAHGISDMTTVLEESLNLGTVFISSKLGLDSFKKYVKDFGFGLPTGIELDSESFGDISSLDRKGQIFLATSSFGQGISVTPLQLINAYATIANDGKLMKPHIVAEVIKPNGEVIKTQPEVIRQAISNRAAKLLTAMLVLVVKEGHSKKAGIEGYLIAAKTGTAQVANTNGPGYSKETIHSLVGFGPAEDPKFVILTRIDKPKDVEFAESSAAPLFKEIAKFIINYWKIEPTE